MLTKLLKKAGYITRAESLKIRQENVSLKHERDTLLAKLEKSRPVIDVDIGDPTPTDPAARKEYIARVAGFHKDIMEKKLMSMISEVRAALDKVDNTPKMDELLKGTSNALWLIYDWGKQAVSEMISYQTDRAEEEREILKDTLNLK